MVSRDCTLHDVHEADTGEPMVLVIETMKGSTRDGWAEIFLGERNVIAVPRENPPAAQAHPLPVNVVVGSHMDGLPSVPLMGSQQHLPCLSLPALALEASGLTRFVVGQPADPSPARFSSRSPL